MQPEAFWFTNPEAFACALSDGTVTTTIHQGTVRSGGNGWLQLTSFAKWVVKSPGEADVEHRWQTQTFAIHKGEAGSIVLWVDITFSSGKLPPWKGACSVVGFKCLGLILENCLSDLSTDLSMHSSIELMIYSQPWI